MSKDGQRQASKKGRSSAKKPIKVLKVRTGVTAGGVGQNEYRNFNHPESP